MSGTKTILANGTFVDAWGRTEQGKVREENQDHFLVADIKKSLRLRGTSMSSDRFEQLAPATTGLLLLVADGVGGADGGEVASREVLETIAAYVAGAMHSFYQLDDTLYDGVRAELAESVMLSRERLVREGLADKARASMATTLTKVHVMWPHAYVVQVGDSRCYLWRGGQLEQLTRDHTVAQELVEQGIMDADVAARSQFRHVLSHSIGARPESDATPDISRVPLEEGDVVMLCSDGLTKHVDDSQVQAILGQGPDAPAMVDALVEAALAGGGTDNVTVVVACFGSAPDGG